MATYNGLRDPNDALENDVWVTDVVDGKTVRRELPLRLDLRNHSPTGFEWGYYGSGPAQLALALLAEEVGDERALRLYQEYKGMVVAKLARPGWKLTSEDVRYVADEIERLDAMRGAPTGG